MQGSIPILGQVLNINFDIPKKLRFIQNVDVMDFFGLIDKTKKLKKKQVIFKIEFLYF
ncbi:hypothetical protein LEP1GSC124_5472 [Leptospira interrogans serovar Pyrogenes str. 200701872]|uniref:Uncharacterized protein n=1 Tax=Leptospira interrogans serovar Pyrogenes str. 200701872 TaxID=1193029 RepID=M7A734_LEPIR|nr:hypothetical protein LEP1GSC124_5472 [Leptospira interrogans serovar Pyrogenes str. 200701872]